MATPRKSRLFHFQPGATVEEYLAETRDFSGVYRGKMSFDAKGDLQGTTYVLWQVRNGRFEQLD